MADPRIDLLANSIPTDGKVSPQSSVVLDTNDRYPHTVIRIDEDNTDATELSSRVGVTGAIEIPASYVGSPVFYVVWKSTKTTGNVVWDIDYTVVSGDDAESLDPSADDQSLSVTDGAGSAARERMVASVAATAGNFAANATLLFGLYRDGTDAADTLAGAVVIESFQLQFAE